MRYSLTLVFLLFFTSLVFTQNYSLTGTISDKQNNSTLPGATVIITDMKDTTRKFYVLSDNNGIFYIDNLKKHSYKITVIYLGYRNAERTVSMENHSQNAGTVFMVAKSEKLNEVVVEGRPPITVQKGDTSEINAGAFKTSSDASAEELVKKMPTITVENGTVKAQGENVQQILVDGKPFFGDDPTITLRNLPADVVDKVQVYNKLSDQAQLTGFDDGNTTKTMNIITKKNRRNGTFGRIYGGISLSDKYQVGENLNYFKGDRRISIISMSNNINQQNFSQQDLLGIAGNLNSSYRYSMGGSTLNNFLIGQQNGVSTTNSIGINYTDTWWDKVKITGSYFFNNTSNTLDQLIDRQSVFPRQITRETNNVLSKNWNNRINFRIEWDPDTMNSIYLVPKLNIQSGRASTILSNAVFNSYNDSLIQTLTNNNAGGNGYSLANDLILRHRFLKKGRTISVDINTSVNYSNTHSSRLTHQLYQMNNASLNDSTDQLNKAISSGNTLSSNFVYTEPAGTIGLIQISYNPSLTRNNSNLKANNLFMAMLGESAIDTPFTNLYNNTFLTNKAGLGFRLKKDQVSGMIGLFYQEVNYNGTISFPGPAEQINRTYDNFLPVCMFNYKFSSKNYLRLMFRTSVILPTVNQLQTDIDNSNPQMLNTGNPALNPEYDYSFITRFSYANPDKSTNFFLFINATYSPDNISNYAFTARKDTLLGYGFNMLPGVTLNSPVNLGNNWGLVSFMTISLPLNFISSNLNLNTGFNYTKTPGKNNNLVNYSNDYVISQGIVIGSSVSENIDFTLSYSGNYNIIQNSLLPNTNSNFYSHSAGFKFGWTFWKGIVFQNEWINQYYRGLTSSVYNQNILLWNISLGKKFLKNNKGDLRLSIFDLLNRNSNINRTVTGNYIQDTRNNALQRFFMLTFTYTLKAFNQPAEN